MSQKKKILPKDVVVAAAQSLIVFGALYFAWAITTTLAICLGDFQC